MREIKHNLVYGLVGGLVGGLVVGLVIGLVVGLVYGLVIGLVYGLVIGLVYGLVVGLVIGLVGGLVASLSIIFITQIIALITSHPEFVMADLVVSGILISLIQMIGWYFVYRFKIGSEDLK